MHWGIKVVLKHPFIIYLWASSPEYGGCILATLPQVLFKIAGTTEPLLSLKPCQTGQLPDCKLHPISEAHHYKTSASFFLSLSLPPLTVLLWSLPFRPPLFIPYRQLPSKETWSGAAGTPADVRTWPGAVQHPIVGGCSPCRACGQGKAWPPGIGSPSPRQPAAPRRSCPPRPRRRSHQVAR